MKRGFGVDVPEGLPELMVPSRLGLVMYDLQVGIVSQLESGKRIVEGCSELLQAARAAEIRVYFMRHFFLPGKLAGVGQLRRGMVWQRKEDPGDVTPFIAYGSSSFQVVPELAPKDGEAIIDKITMSAFEGTWLNLAMRDVGLQAFLIAGIALEIGIEPTVRHALDLNYVPIVVADLCGSRSEELHARSLETLKDTGEVILTTLDEVLPILRGITSHAS